MLIQLSANDTKFTDHRGGAHADIVFLGNIVKVDPTAVGAGNDALGPEDHTIAAGIQAMKSRFHFGSSELLGSFHAPGGKDLVGMMIMMVMAAAAMLTMLMMMIVVMTAATVMLFVVMIMMVVVTAAMMLFVVMIMVVMVTAAAVMLFVVMIMMVVVTAAMVFLVIMLVMVMVTAAVMLFMVMIVVTAAAMAFLMIVVMMMVMMFLFQFCQRCGQGCLAFHGLQKLRTGQFVPGCNYQGSLRIVFSQERHSGVQFDLGNGIGAGQNDGGSGLDLIVIELAEVLHIDLDLAGIGNGHGIAQLHILIGHLLNGSDHIAEFANAGGLDDDTLGGILLDDLVQCLAEITHQAAADAAGVHLGDVNTGILQETAINADLAEFVLDQH